MKLEQLRGNLVDMRKAFGVTQKDIATAMGVPQSRVSHIEIGRHGLTVETVIRYVEACGGKLEITAMMPVPDGSAERVRLL